MFFKRSKEEDEVKATWKLYKTLNHRGFVFYIKGNIRIQVTTNEKIFFYMIDMKTFMPTLENVMGNYMNCNQMMFGSKVRYCITFKTNEKSFEVFKRKYEHNFKVEAHCENFEGSTGRYLNSIDCYIVSDYDKVKVFDSNTFKERKELQIDVPLLKSDTREKN